MKDINIDYKERLVDAELAFSILNSRYDGLYRQNSDVIANLAEAGKYRIELKNLVTFDELKRLSADPSKISAYLESKIKEIEAERIKIKQMYDISEIKYDDLKRQDSAARSNFAEVCQYDLSVRSYAEKLQDKLDDREGISLENKNKKLEERRKIALAAAVRANDMFSIAETMYNDLGRQDIKSIGEMAEAGKYLNGLNAYIDDVEYDLLDKEKDNKEYLVKLYAKQKEILKEKAVTKVLFNIVKPQYDNLKRQDVVVLGKIASVMEYRCDVLKRLEKIEEHIVELGGQIPAMSPERIKAVINENEQDVKLFGDIYGNIKIQYDVVKRQKEGDISVIEKFAEVSSCLLSVEQRANRFKHKPENKSFYYSGDEKPEEIAKRESVRKQLVAEGDYIPSLKYLETASPKAYWVKQGLYGKKNPLGYEFQGVAADKREQIIHDRTVAVIGVLKEKGLKTAAEHFKLKI